MVSTISVVQCGGWRYKAIDLLSGKEIKVDVTNYNYIGLTEVIIESVDKLVDIIKKVEKLRYTDRTNMNSTSSRTNVIIDYKTYRKVGEKLQITSFKFVDMAGSERIEKSGLDSGPTWKNGQLSLAAVINNVCLSEFQRVVAEIS